MVQFPAPLQNEKQAAEWLGLSVRWLQESRVTGEGPPFLKIGRSVRYRIEDLDAWSRERLHRSTSEYQAA